jgi:hypothetical protein
MGVTQHYGTASVATAVMDYLEQLTIGRGNRERCHRVENQIAVAARITSPAVSDASMR